MNLALALDLPVMPTIDLRELLTNVGLPIGRKPPAADKLLDQVEDIIDHLLLSMIERRTLAAFREARSMAFENYVRSTRIKSDLLKLRLPAPDAGRLVSEGLSQIESDFREEGARRFGENAAEQAAFTLWTFRKAGLLAAKMDHSQVAPEDVAQDLELARLFAAHCLWADFHLNCMIAAMRHDRSIYPDVLAAITDGLRAAVNAYGLLQQGRRLRARQVEIELDPPAAVMWDGEDQQLLDESMRDMAREAI